MRVRCELLSNIIHTCSFQDRGKRFRLQQFICKHANKLFNRHVKPVREDPFRGKLVDSGLYPVLPPFEWFISIDKELRLQRFFEVRKISLVLHHQDETQNVAVCNVFVAVCVLVYESGRYNCRHSSE